jgi:hypothetical protein
MTQEVGFTILFSHALHGAAAVGLVQKRGTSFARCGALVLAGGGHVFPSNNSTPTHNKQKQSVSGMMKLYLHALPSEPFWRVQLESDHCASR